MSNTTAIILSSFIAAGAVLLTVLIDKIFHAISDKRVRKDRFFYEIFPMRVDAYKEILRTIPKLGAHNLFAPKASPYELSDMFKSIGDNINNLLSANILFTSIDVAKRLTDLGILSYNHSDMALHFEQGTDVREGFVDNFRTNFQSFYDQLIERIRVETGIHIIDNEITNFIAIAENEAEHEDKKRHSKKTNKGS